MLSRSIKLGIVLCCSMTMLLGLGACATQKKYSERLHSWIGRPVDDLYVAWGPPANSVTLSDGGKIIEYRHSQGVPLTNTTLVNTPQSGTFHVRGSPSNIGGSTGTYHGSSTTLNTTTSTLWLQCTTRCTVTAQGIIQKFTFTGNYCVSE